MNRKIYTNGFILSFRHLDSICFLWKILWKHFLFKSSDTTYTIMWQQKLTHLTIWTWIYTVILKNIFIVFIRFKLANTNNNNLTIYHFLKIIQYRKTTAPWRWWHFITPVYTAPVGISTTVQLDGRKTPVQDICRQCLPTKESYLSYLAHICNITLFIKGPIYYHSWGIYC